jgi:hypothetical protein
MCGGAYSVDYRFEGDVFYMNFRLPINIRGLRVTRNEEFFNIEARRRGFYGFGNKSGYFIGRVFIHMFIGGREQFKNFRFTLGGVHNN